MGAAPDDGSNNGAPAAHAEKMSGREDECAHRCFLDVADIRKDLGELATLIIGRMILSRVKGDSQVGKRCRDLPSHSFPN
jgi:hypothetical protein